MESELSEVPSIVQEFIGKYVRSVTALEILLVLQESPRCEWGTLEISTALELAPAVVAARLNELKSAGLVSGRSIANQQFYRFVSPTHETDLAINRLAKAYSMYPVRIIGLVKRVPKSRDSSNLLVWLSLGALLRRALG
jgi:hypothetical protein